MIKVKFENMADTFFFKSFPDELIGRVDDLGGKWEISAKHDDDCADAVAATTERLFSMSIF